MFDWPEQIQTSPTSTSSNGTVFLPRTVMVCGPPAGIGSSTTCQLPSEPALAVLALLGDLNRDVLARFCPSPDPILLIALEDHVVAEDGRQLHVGLRSGGLSGQESQQDRGGQARPETSWKVRVSVHRESPYFRSIESRHQIMPEK